MDKILMRTCVLLVLWLTVLPVNARLQRLGIFRSGKGSVGRRQNGKLDLNKLVKLDLNRINLQIAYQLLEKLSENGTTFTDARKRSGFLDSIIKNLNDRIKNDPKIPDEQRQSMVVSSYAGAFCALCMRLRRQDCIRRFCYAG